ncbi:XAC2610-related protein [Pedobacter vanadiisoli]|uniref:XAC2610-related protein n=1 Tax=Pedobacter vanadiisoli TaxID=1761975 RepID=A0ABW5MNP7_9SPHI
MKKLIIFCSIFLLAHTAEAQFKFLANNSSDQYKAKIIVDRCQNSACDGKATIILYDKITDSEIDTFHSDDLEFGLTEKQDAKLGWLELGKYQTPLIFGDFNFDGLEDIAIRNGNKGSYSSPSYDIYLAASKNKFLLNSELTQLASQNLGMFDIDKKAKQLSIHQKDGCCFDKTINYRYDSKNILYEDSSVIEDSTIADYVTVITQKLVDGKMKRTVQKFKMKDYYNQ